MVIRIHLLESLPANPKPNCYRTLHVFERSDAMCVRNIALEIDAQNHAAYCHSALRRRTVRRDLGHHGHSLQSDSLLNAESQVRLKQNIEGRNIIIN